MTIDEIEDLGKEMSKLIHMHEHNEGWWLPDYVREIKYLCDRVIELDDIVEGYRAVLNS